MYDLANFKPRGYQSAILETAKEKNTLVCLPTGTGKTKLAIMVAIVRLNKFPDSSIVICSPTKPLTNQIWEEFKESTDVPKGKINALTGEMVPLKRKNYWEMSKIIVATPQTIESDIKNKRIFFENVSLLVIDECHRSRMNFANTKVAKEYMEKAKNPLILALTASPGSVKEKVDEICKNLFIEAIEIRTKDDEDMQEHVQERKNQRIKVDLSPELEQVRGVVKSVYQKAVKSLRGFGLTKPAGLVNKRDLIVFQRVLQKEIQRGNRMAYAGISIVAQCVKLSYLLELIETQTTNSVNEYFKKLKTETSKAAKKIIGDASIKRVEKLIEKLCGQNFLHPKMEKLREIIKERIEKDKELKVIVFANYRNTVTELESLLNEIPGCKAVTLVGQKEGLNQKMQRERIEKFNTGKANVLIATCIGEEGIHIASASLAIFYEPIASEIRKIQREGRVGRVKEGEIIFLIAKGTRDEGLMWTAHHKEKKMKNILTSMKNKMEKQMVLK